MTAMPGNEDAWEAVARHDPYWGVITHPDYLGPALAPETEERFFASGDHQVSHILAVIRDHLRPGFQPVTALDYGCGVGRNLPALARECDRVVGLDVSPTMLARARQHLDERGVADVELRHAGDLGAFAGGIDLVHCVLVLQHVPPRRGMVIFDRLVTLLRPGGCACIQFNLRAAGGPVARRARWIRTRVPLVNTAVAMATHQPPSARHVLMYEYDLVDIVRVLTSHTVTTMYVELGAAPPGHTAPTLYFTAPDSGVRPAPPAGG
jgi:SAM-dependent methyltransferase